MLEFLGKLWQYFKNATNALLNVQLLFSQILKYIDCVLSA